MKKWGIPFIAATIKNISYTQVFMFGCVIKIKKNGYTELEGTLVKGAESGCYFAVERLFNNFSSLKHTLSKYPSDVEAEKSMYEISGIPTPNMFNANVYSTYLCSLIEEYFRTTYIALLKYSDRKEKILNVKFSPYDMVDISNGEKTVEEVFASTLSFQVFDYASQASIIICFIIKMILDVAAIAYIFKVIVGEMTYTND